MINNNTDVSQQDGPGNDNYNGTPISKTGKKLTGPDANYEKPLENLIREALEYDSLSYK